MTFVIISGGIDISVGSLVALVSMITAGIMVKTGSIAMGVLCGLVTGGLVGVANGVFISRFRVPPFIMTMGMKTVCRGLALTYAGGMPIVGLPKAFGFLGSGYWGPVPVPVVLALVAFAFTWFILKYTLFGRYTYAIGGNEDAAVLSGIDVLKTKMSIYIASGLLTAAAAIVLTSRIISGYPSLGEGLELEAIASVVIGGGTLGGGAGSALGTFFGVLIMGTLTNGLNLMNVSSYTQQIVIGLIIVFGVLFDVVRKRRNR